MLTECHEFLSISIILHSTWVGMGVPAAAPGRRMGAFLSNPRFAFWNKTPRPPRFVPQAPI